MSQAIMEKKTNSHYSNAAVYETCLGVSRVVGKMFKVMPYNLKRSIFEWAVVQEAAILQERYNTGNYPARTWWGLNGVDQYDIIADFVMFNAYEGEVR